MRFIGAVALLGVGAVDLQQYFGANFRTVPTIGSLFLLNAIGCAVVGFTLLMPIERALSARRTHFASLRWRSGSNPAHATEEVLQVAGFCVSYTVADVRRQGPALALGRWPLRSARGSRGA
jgi:hypothetical protein